MVMGVSGTVPTVQFVRYFFFVATASCFGQTYAESWKIDPELSLAETYSTNMTLTAGPHLQGWISDIAPALRITGTGGRIKANLDYRLDNLHYAGHPELERNQNTLASDATVEAIEKWLFIDAGATIQQRKASPFSAASVGTNNATSAQSETRTANVSPYIRGQFSDIAAYQMRINALESQSSDATLASTHATQVTGALKNASSGAKIGWSMNADAAKIENSIIGDRFDGRLSGRLTFAIVPQFHLSFSDGIEKTNYAGNGLQSWETPGLGLEWSPSPRTQAAVQGEKRFFGTAHTLLLNHRTAWTNWRYTDTKDASALATTLAGSGQGAISDMMSDLLTASIPDPATREAAVRARFDRATAAQVGPAAVQSSRISINHTQELSIALLGIRNTITLSLHQLDQEAIGNVTGVADSFALSSNLRQQGGSLSWQHRLSPLTTFSYTAGRQHSAGLSVANLDSEQRSHAANVAYRLAPQTYASMGARKVSYESTLNGRFREYAALFALTHRF
jgi:uncharacterized protein (PEP-CTERM system associated)